MTQPLENLQPDHLNNNHEMTLASARLFEDSIKGPPNVALSSDHKINPANSEMQTAMLGAHPPGCHCPDAQGLPCCRRN